MSPKAKKNTEDSAKEKLPFDHEEKNMVVPPRVERQRIAAHASCDERSVKRAYEGQMIRSTTRERIVQAALALAVRPPPEPGS